MGFHVLLYLGPGISVGAIALVIIIFAIILLSIGIILWSTFKNICKRVFKKWKN